MMQLIEPTTIWLNAKDGYLSHKDASKTEGKDASKTEGKDASKTEGEDARKSEIKVYGYTGIINGVGTREKRFEDQNRIELTISMFYEELNQTAMISGTLVGSSGKITVFGKSLLSCLAHEDCAKARGEKVRLSVFGGKGAENSEHMTICRLHGPGLIEIRGFDTKSLPEHLIPETVDRWLKTAMQTFGELFRGLHEAGFSGRSNTSDMESDRPLAEASAVAESDLPF